MVYSSTARGSIVCLHFVFMYSKWDLDKIWHTYTRFQESIANRRRDCGRTKKSTAGSGQGELGTLKWGGLQLSSYGCLQSWSPPTLSASLGGSRWPDPAVCSSASTCKDSGQPYHPNIFFTLATECSPRFINSVWRIQSVYFVIFNLIF